MAKRSDRIGAIRKLVRAEEVKTQKRLVERLQDLGFDCTQATVSRDIADLGLVKSPRGHYMLHEDMIFERLVNDITVTVEDAGNLVVVKTRPGSASMLAEAIDNSELEGVVGTIAGDNTIMVVARTEQDAQALRGHLQHMLARVR